MKRPVKQIAAFAALAASFGVSVSSAGAAPATPPSMTVQCMAYLEPSGATQDTVISRRFQTTSSIATVDRVSLDNIESQPSPVADAFEGYVKQSLADRRVSGPAVCMPASGFDQYVADVPSHNAAVDRSGDGFRINIVQADWPPSDNYPELPAVLVRAQTHPSAKARSKATVHCARQWTGRRYAASSSRALRTCRRAGA
jgi:hypothetical protein